MHLVHLCRVCYTERKRRCLSCEKSSGGQLLVLLSAALLLTGTASAAAQIDPVEERLAAMSLREKVGQLFVVRVEALDPSGQSDSTRLTWAERQGLKKYPVGGIVVFRQNVKSPEQLKKLLADFQAASGTGLLTAVDEEGGSVARLANASGFDLPQYQSSMSLQAVAYKLEGDIRVDHMPFVSIVRSRLHHSRMATLIITVLIWACKAGRFAPSGTVTSDD